MAEIVDGRMAEIAGGGMAELAREKTHPVMVGAMPRAISFR